MYIYPISEILANNAYLNRKRFFKNRVVSLSLALPVFSWPTVKHSTSNFPDPKLKTLENTALSLFYTFGSPV